MAKSQIIKDLANASIDLSTALKRTKILLQDLGNEELIKWVDSELSGYSEDADLPMYRRIHGQLYGSYMKGSMVSHMQYTHVPLPLGNMPDDLKNNLLTVSLMQGLETLRAFIKTLESTKQRLVKFIPPELYPAIALANNDPYMIISSANVELNMPEVLNIFSIVENKLLDILLYLEKQFGNLDALDIDISTKSKEELNRISDNIYVTIFNDKSVKIGNDNTIEDTDIASSISK